MYTVHKLRSLIEVDPTKALQELQKKYRGWGCSQKAVALELGCSQGTLIRYIKRLDELGVGATGTLLQEKQRAIRNGTHHVMNRRGGRPARA